jgi:hypothetical protein
MGFEFPRMGKENGPEQAEVEGPGIYHSDGMEGGLRGQNAGQYVRGFRLFITCMVIVCFFACLHVSCVAPVLCVPLPPAA